MVPPLTMAIRLLPSRAMTVFATRSQVTRGRSSAKSSEANTAGEHIEHVLEHRLAQLRERRGPAHRGVERIDAPGLDRRHRDDLLAEHVERVPGMPGGLHAPVGHRLGQRSAGHQVAAVLREDDPGARGIDAVTGASDALHAAGHRRRGLDLGHQIYRAHVDAQLERGGCHQRPEAPGLERLLDLAPLRARQGAVVRPDQRLAGELVQRRRQPLGDAPAVDEDERGAVLADQVQQPRMDGGPD